MFAELLRERLAGVCTIAREQVQQLECHYELLLRWGRVLNLTSVLDPAEIVERHYCESLFLGAHLSVGEWKIADIGSGAGFPGFPVAVLRPECTVSLIESHQRKTVFLKEACRGYSNISVIARRSEDVENRFDWAISRAVKYSDIRSELIRLGRRIALLTGDVSEAELPGLQWKPRVRLPWGDRRFLFVSRET